MAVAPDALWPLVSLTGLIAPLSLLAYFCLRMYCLIYTQIVGRYQLGLAWFWIIIELFQYLPTILLYLNRVFVFSRPRRPQLYLQGNDVPAVAVMITACGEDHDTILNVVRAACETHWPKDRLSVILCDDGRSKELEEKMGHVKRKYPHAHYTSRPKPEVPDYVCFSFPIQYVTIH
jgi:cellulose synthase/poly-beta-1,6-N-acetylglucosamine synthase-like glycosyltransferase